MASRAEHLRNSIINGRSPLRKHSLDSSNMAKIVHGEEKFYRSQEQVIKRKKRNVSGPANLDLLPPLPCAYEIILFPNSAIEICEIVNAPQPQ